MSKSFIAAEFEPRIEKRRRGGVILSGVLFVSTLIGIVVLMILLVDVTVKGLPWLSMEFLTGTPVSADAERIGIRPAILGSAFLMVLTALFAVDDEHRTRNAAQQIHSLGGVRRLRR